ncbi:hypothetical protein F5882DRAFT_75271 [Hyaloscypha sp. PMI_1271]|nr:hypothetical protein F5882DRAFT_75271 [Hyaloscypha sp. PMI_1271]
MLNCAYVLILMWRVSDGGQMSVTLLQMVQLPGENLGCKSDFRVEKHCALSQHLTWIFRSASRFLVTVTTINLLVLHKYVFRDRAPMKINSHPLILFLQNGEEKLNRFSKLRLLFTLSDLIPIHRSKPHFTHDHQLPYVRPV